jgi:CheY-like chemotaxis protein
MLAIGLALPGIAQEAPVVEYEETPLTQNSIQQDWLRQDARAEQERYRLRVAVPQAEVAGPAAPVGSHKALQGSAQPIVLRFDGNYQDVLLGALVCLAGLLALVKLAPDSAYRVLAGLNPRKAPAPLAPDLSAKAVADEQAFNQFLAAFKAGPQVSARALQFPQSSPVFEDAEAGKEALLEPAPDPLRTFFDQAPAHLLEMRKLLQEIGHTLEPPPRQKLLGELYDRVSTLRGMAGLAELLPAWQVSSASEWLLKQLLDRPGKITPSALRTVANGVDLLYDLCKPGIRAELCTRPPVRFLAVDDDSISRHAVCFSLKKAFNQPDVASNGEAALALASGIVYDVIFLDIQMPGMDGFELCSKIRQTQLNQATPVVFVTCQTDFDARAKSSLCGGNDFLTKPFLTFEITLKALTLALRARIRPADDKANVASENRDNGRGRSRRAESALWS